MPANHAILDWSDATAMETRGDGPRSFRLRARLSCDKALPQQVIATDVTRSGCRVTGARSLRVGVFVTLEIPGFVALSGWVAWSGHQMAGIDFGHPLSPDVLAHVVDLGSGVGD